MNIIKPKLSAIIKTSGVKSPVRWIDLDEGTCKTEAGFEAPIGDFSFVDDRDYDSLRGEYAGRAMQGIWSNEMQTRAVIEKITDEQPGCPDVGDAVRRRIAQLAVAQADALIYELKREHDLGFYGIVVKDEED